MLESAVAPHAEELREVESQLLVYVFVQEVPQVIGVDVHAGQTRVGVGVAHVYFVPFGLGALLHHIVPSEDFLLFAVVKQIEWRTREAQHFGR